MSGSSLETRPGNTLQHDPAFVREAFARFLTDRLFPKLRSQHPDLYIADVGFINDWEYAAKYSPNDPLNIKVGDFASNRAAALATVSWLHKGQQSVLLHELQQGDTTGARRTLQGRTRMNITHHNLAYPLDKKTGTAKETGKMTTWDEVKGGIADIPSQTGKTFGDIFGGLSGALGSHLVLIVVVLAVVLLLKKK